MSASGLGTETRIRPVAPITGVGEGAPEPVEAPPSDAPAIDWLAVTLVLLAASFLGGVVLAPGYRPLPDLAALDLYDLRQASGLAFLSQLHRALGFLALLTLGLHLLQSAARGAYRGPRRRAWWLGLLLLSLVGGLALSGRMLPWDTLARWLALTIGLGDGASALAWIWTSHSLLLPIVLLLVAVWRWKARDRGED